MVNMSFHITKKQFLDGSKDVTRRIRHYSKNNPKEVVGWGKLKPDGHFSAVEKSQGLRKGERINYFGQCICISNEPEPLNEIIKRPYRNVTWDGAVSSNRSEMAREGFPDLTAKEFVDMFCAEMKCHPTTIVNRIEFRRYQNGTTTKKVHQDL